MENPALYVGNDLFSGRLACLPEQAEPSGVVCHFMLTLICVKQYLHLYAQTARAVSKRTWSGIRVGKSLMLSKPEDRNSALSCSAVRAWPRPIASK